MKGQIGSKVTAKVTEKSAGFGWTALDGIESEDRVQ